MPEPHRGQRPEAKRNISGLRNQHALEPLELPTESSLDCAQELPIHESDEKLQEDSNDDLDQEGWDPLLELDSLKPCWEREDQGSDEENVDANDENMEILTEGMG
ncbi:hypothetical protein C0992_011832 [Termitomyces sp. T32_za158]|nr:hypothetical protein C0992_011832 [Termitomyces sp. T32_za158]